MIIAFNFRTSNHFLIYLFLFIFICTLIMKVKFLSKKEREQLKLQKNNNSATLNTNVAQSIRQKVNQLEQIQQTDNAKLSQPKRAADHKKIPQFSEHFIGLENQEQANEKRERSRDKKFEQLVEKEEEAQRQKMKKTVLGLVKLEPPPRNNITYRNQLLFQWNKNDDTSQGFVPIINLDGSHKSKDALQSISNENWKNKPYERMEERDWRIFRQDHQIYIRGGKAPHPIRQWRQLQGISQRLISNLQSLKFEKPKPIQMQAVPIGISKKDLMAIAPTGQGKTLAYLLPIVHFLLPLERLNMISFQDGPYALVVVPTRELAEQIHEQFKKITKGLSLTAFCAVGGYQFELQAMQLSKGCQLLIATPGRVKEFIEKHQLSLSRLSWLVIDQADKMVSENLSEDIEFILENSVQQITQPQNQRKTIHMFSATMIPQIQKLAKSYLAASYTYITIGEPGGGKKQIEQHVQLINQTSKLDHVCRILKRLEGPIIVFVNSRQNCEKVSKMIEKRCERKIAEYHGGKSQEAREKVIAQFRTGKIEILIATDLAGRGLDVKGINAVINYDAPKNISQFIHRSGRTGRAGMKGKAFTLLTPQDEEIFYDLRVFLQRNGFSIPQNLKDNPASQVRPGGVLNVARRKQIVYTN